MCDYHRQVIYQRHYRASRAEQRCRCISAAIVRAGMLDEI